MMNQSQGRALNPSTGCVLVSELARTQCSQALDGISFTHTRDGARPASAMGADPLRLAGLSQGLMQKMNPCDPPVAQQKDTVPSPRRRDNSGVGQVPSDTNTLDKRALLMPPNIPTQGDNPGTGCTGSSSLVRKCSRPKTDHLQGRLRWG